MLARCDLHLHSSASRESQEWLPRRFGCPESYAEPAAQYELCKARGMSFVTLTDHDTIEGGLQLIDRPDFFLSEEVTARVPPAPGHAGDDDACVAHVLAWNITPADHDRLQALRSDVFALVDYLRARGIAHALAHPFESPNRKLDAPTLERLMLLFSTFEVVNGRTDERLNAGARALVEATDARALRRLSGLHGLPPARGLQRPVAVVGGSDDHEHPRAATCWTEVDGARDARALLEAVMAGQARAVGRGADVVGLGAVFGATAHRFLAELGREGGPPSPFSDVMEALAGRNATARATSGGHREFLDRLARVARQALPAGGTFDSSAVTTATDAAALGAAQIRVCDALVGDAASAAVDAAIDADFFALFGALRDAAGGIKAMLPFLFAADHLGRQVQDMARLGRGWTASSWPAPAERLAVFADTLSQVDGVSTWCKRFLDEAARDGREVWMPHCGPVSDAIRTADTARCFVELPEIAGVTLPPSIYQDLRLALPSFVAVVAWMQQAGISHVEVATPGPLGLAGLLAAKVLRLPVRATYHTEVPALVRMLTGSASLERWAATYVGWFYRQVDRATVFSDGAFERLVALGVPAERVERRDLAVDPEDFSPRHAQASNDVDAELDLDLPAGRPVVLTVGRLSREKNVPLMIEAMARLGTFEPRPLLVVVGDGPERARLEALAAGRADVRLVGARGGATLRRLYARADAFVFASEIDTLGLAAMEAMSSGAPVLIPRGANLSAMVEHRRSAYLYAPTPDALAAALREVLTDRELAALLGREGRARMVAQWSRAHGGAVSATCS